MKYLKDGVYTYSNYEPVQVPTLEEWCTWLEAEENQNKQATRCLHVSNSDAYCCLGANLHLAGAPKTEENVEAIFFGSAVAVWPPEWGEAYGLTDNGTPPPVKSILQYDAYPKDFTEKLFSIGLTADTVYSLAEMNDGGLSFRDIAAVIRHWREKGWIHDVQR